MRNNQIPPFRSPPAPMPAPALNDHRRCQCGLFKAPAAGTSHVQPMVNSLEIYHTEAYCGPHVPSRIVLNPPADPLLTFDEWYAELRMRVGRLTSVARQGADNEVITEQSEFLAHARRRIAQ